MLTVISMMTGSILGGASVSQAAKYQEIILYLISASNLTSVFASVCMTTFFVCIDSSHRLRTERIKTKQSMRLIPKSLAPYMRWSKLVGLWQARSRRGAIYEQLMSPASFGRSSNSA